MLQEATAVSTEAYYFCVDIQSPLWAQVAALPPHGHLASQGFPSCIILRKVTENWLGSQLNLSLHECNTGWFTHITFSHVIIIYPHLNSLIISRKRQWEPWARKNTSGDTFLYDLSSFSACLFLWHICSYCYPWKVPSSRWDCMVVGKEEGTIHKLEGVSIILN